MGKILDITFVYPGGNKTALVKGLVPKTQKKSVNDWILNKFPSVEQVGFFIALIKKLI